MTSQGPIRLKPSPNASLLRMAKALNTPPSEVTRILKNRRADKYERTAEFREKKNQDIIDNLPEIEAAMVDDFNNLYRKLPIKELYKLIAELKHIRRNTFMTPIEKELTDRRIEVAKVCLSARIMELQYAVEHHLNKAASNKWHAKMDDEKLSISDVITIQLMENSNSFVNRYGDEDPKHEANRNKEKNKYYNAKKDEEGLYIMNDYQYENIFESSGKMKKFDAKGRLVDVKKKKKNKTKENQKNHPILNKIANLVKRVQDLFHFVVETFIPSLKKDSQKTAKMIKKEARKAVKVLTSTHRTDIESGKDLDGLTVVSGEKKDKKKKKKNKK